MRALANFIAIREPDPLRRTRLLAPLYREGYTAAAIWDDWVVAEAPLLGRADVRAVALSERRLLFAEGREGIVRDASSPEAWRSACETFARGAPGLDTWGGDFTALMVSPGGEIAVVRSVSGRVPVYVLPDRTRPVIGTQLGAVLRHSPRPLTLDPWPTALRMETVMPDQRRSVLAGVEVLPPGHYTTAASSFAPALYWSPLHIPTRPPSRAGQQQHAERLRDCLVRSIASEIDDDTLLALSGGFDSSCIAVIAHGLGRSFSTLTFLPPDPRDQKRERFWLQRVRRHISPSVRRHWERPLSAVERLELLQAAPKVVIPYRHAALAMLPRLQAEGRFTTLMGGEGADELFGSITVHEDWMTATRPLDLLRLPRAIPFAARHARRYARHLYGWMTIEPPLPLPQQMCALFQPSLRQHYAMWRRRTALNVFRSRAARPLLELRYRALCNGMAAHWEVCSSLGIARSFPFITRGLIELAFEAHPAEGLGWGAKRLSRLGLETLVPAAIRARRDKGVSRHGSSPAVRWEEPIPEELAEVVRPLTLPPQCETLGILEALRLRALLNIVGALRTERHCHEHS